MRGLREDFPVSDLPDPRMSITTGYNHEKINVAKLFKLCKNHVPDSGMNSISNLKILI